MDPSEIAATLRRYTEPLVAYKLDAAFAAAVTEAANMLDPDTPKLKPCAFCGGQAKIVVCDDVGNIHDDDYRNDPWSGLTFAIIHDGSNAGANCPIAMHEGDGTMGRYGYATEEEAAEAWNNRTM